MDYIFHNIAVAFGHSRRGQTAKKIKEKAQWNTQTQKIVFTSHYLTRNSNKAEPITKMSSNLYSHREQQNNQKFDQLANTLHQFRTTVNNDIHDSIEQELGLLHQLNDNFSSLMQLVKKTLGNLTTVMNRNAGLTRIVGIILGAFFVIWMLFKLL